LVESARNEKKKVVNLRAWPEGFEPLAVFVPDSAWRGRELVRTGAEAGHWISIQESDRLSHRRKVAVDRISASIAGKMCRAIWQTDNNCLGSWSVWRGKNPF
jgi:hypothetical protein